MPVEWTRLPGETVEDLVAVMLCRRNPSATVIRPSVGDGGIDVIAPSGGDVEVYQVKKFATNLTSSQKRQIEKSFARFVAHRHAKSLEVRQWFLTLPLDPTKENLEWFDGMTAGAPFQCEWRGLNFVDGLAAEFPDVIDYYIHDGAERLARVVSQTFKLLGLKQESDGAGIITPAQLGEQLHALQPLLDSDPHFVYGISLDPKMPEIGPREPELLLEVSSGRSGGGVVTVRVYPRFAEALSFRPIPMQMSIAAAEPDSEFAAELQAFRKFGSPMKAPPGSVSLTADLPGGLGGSFDGGSAWIGASWRADGRPELLRRLAAVDPAGVVVGEVVLRMQPPSVGTDRTGMREHGIDRDQVFDMELLTDLELGQTTFSLTIRDVTGRHPSEILPALRVLALLRPPNSLVIAQPFGPVSGSQMPCTNDWLNFSELETLLAAVEALEDIQGHTTDQLVVPPLDEVATSLEAWLAAQSLLAGDVVTDDTIEFQIHLNPGVETPADRFTLMKTSDFGVHVGDAAIDLGTLMVHWSAVEVVRDSLSIHEDHVDCSVRMVEGSLMTWRLVRRTRE